MAIILDIASFRAMFPEYGNATTYPDLLVTMNWDNAVCYVSDSNYGSLVDNCRARAIYLMTAHLFKINDVVATGETPAMLSGASIDKISVSVTPPNNASQLDWWLNLTAYGQQLLALLKMRSKGGLYVGGYAERSNFRKMDGSF